MLNALLQISFNGPKLNIVECRAFISLAVKKWMSMKKRKKLPLVPKSQEHKKLVHDQNEMKAAEPEPQLPEIDLLLQPSPQNPIKAEPEPQPSPQNQMKAAEPELQLPEIHLLLQPSPQNQMKAAEPESQLSEIHLHPQPSPQNQMKAAEPEPQLPEIHLLLQPSPQYESGDEQEQSVEENSLDQPQDPQNLTNDLDVEESFEEILVHVGLDCLDNFDSGVSDYFSGSDFEDDI